MARSHETNKKKEKEKIRLKKKKDKKERLEARRGSAPKSFEDQLAYVDEFGRITTTPPDPAKRTFVNAEDIEIGVGSREIAEDEVLTGIIKFFNKEKGYGFVEDSSNGSLFFHVNNVIDSVEEGNKVSYDLGRNERGPIAINVRLFEEVK